MLFSLLACVCFVIVVVVFVFACFLFCLCSRKGDPLDPCAVGDTRLGMRACKYRRTYTHPDIIDPPQVYTYWHTHLRVVDTRMHSCSSSLMPPIYLPVKIEVSKKHRRMMITNTTPLTWDNSERTYKITLSKDLRDSFGQTLGDKNTVFEVKVSPKEFLADLQNCTSSLGIQLFYAHTQHARALGTRTLVHTGPLAWHWITLTRRHTHTCARMHGAKKSCLTAAFFC